MLATTPFEGSDIPHAKWDFFLGQFWPGAIIDATGVGLWVTVEIEP